jgi:hypothetical protein
MEAIILGLLSIGVAIMVLRPLFQTAWSGYDWDGTGVERAGADIAPELRSEVDGYRQALRAGTLCDRCGQANEPGSRFCGECGRPLAGAAQPA